jgi:hypothetical protein
VTHFALIRPLRPWCALLAQRIMLNFKWQNQPSGRKSQRERQGKL